MIDQFEKENNRRETIARIQDKIWDEGFKSLTNWEQTFIAFESGFGCATCGGKRKDFVVKKAA